ncbi:diguanylate cyclase [Pseudomonas putida]|uniref:Diguanylate cyclase n=1 Tax=Pseudomonas putida TaxID=303 RepID=A0A1L5PMT5_PSEPU|nr:diguanylate cyclase [Pseudomonas putida]
MGAALAANTGEAGARHRVACFAGEPAPTGIAVTFSFAQYLWERL